jgi:septal ring factor EnvC (AmiA/AmiB activator)
MIEMMIAAVPALIGAWALVWVERCRREETRREKERNSGLTQVQSLSIALESSQKWISSLQTEIARLQTQVDHLRESIASYQVAIEHITGRRPAAEEGIYSGVDLSHGYGLTGPDALAAIGLADYQVQRTQ